MRKIILDLREITSSEDIQAYLAEKLEFPEYYGMNLDALHDCLTDIDEPTCLGIFEPYGDHPVVDYLRRLRMVIRDSEAENDNLGVIWGIPEDNFEEEYLM